MKDSIKKCQDPKVNLRPSQPFAAGFYIRGCDRSLSQPRCFMAIVNSHLKSEELYTYQYRLISLNTTSPVCRGLSQSVNLIISGLSKSTSLLLQFIG